MMQQTQWQAILKGIVGDAVSPESVNLWPRIEQELLRRGATRRSLSSRARRLALPAAIIAVVLALSLLLVGPERALAALRGLLGYIPGVGLVEESDGLRVLLEPVSLERDGITVTVEQVVLDAGRTVLVYSIDGIPPEAFPPEVQEVPRGAPSNVPPMCNSLPQLRLPEGRSLQITSGTESGWRTGYQSRLVYQSVPATVSQATLFLPCLSGTSPGAAPEDWALPLRFVPAPEDFVVVPVIEQLPAVEDPGREPDGTEAADETGQATAAAPAGLVLEQVIELEDSYILMGTFRQGDLFPGETVLALPGFPELTDAEGDSIQLTIPAELDLSFGELGVIPWGFEVPKGLAVPLTIEFRAVQVEIPVAVDFEFDVGPHPQPDQEWSLGQEFELAGFIVRLESAVRVEPGYELRFTADEAVTGVSVDDLDHQPSGGFGGGTLGSFSVGFRYDDPVPTGLLHFRITHLIAQQSGPWTLTWEPPAGN